MRRVLPIITLIVAMLIAVMPLAAQRRITPVENTATATQPINEFEGDTARINAIKRASLTHYHDDQGRIVYIDTITGREWVDSTALEAAKKKSRIQYPKWHSVSVGVDVMQPVLRLFGQHHGLIEAWGELSIHNRFKPVIEIGLGSANNTPASANFTYRTPVAPFFRVGMNYNFMYGSPTTYSVFAGVRYGFSSFRYNIVDVTIDDSYWGESESFNLPSQTGTVGWGEIVAGLRVNLWRDLSAGWTVRYHHILHQKYGPYGDAWYVPGIGVRSSSLAASFSFCYTFSLANLNKENTESIDKMNH